MGDEGMTAVARAALEYLAARHTQAIGAAKVAEWISLPLPKVQAGLTFLRAEGFVRYFAGHPGTWAVTPTGVGEIDAVDASIQRFQMALEAITIVTKGSYNDEARTASALALRGLGRQS